MTDAVRVEGLTKSFNGVKALDDVSFTVGPGTVFGLLGPNGAGKTTCIRILTTVIRADRGQASILGLDVERDARAVRLQLGLAGQYAAVDPNLTGRENLRLMGHLSQMRRTASRTRADELLSRFDLMAAADRPVRTYSGGMRRRLDVAAALVSRPPVLFLDEPTTGLDPGSRNELWEVIRELVHDGTTVLLTTQYLEEADRLAERLVVIDRGRVIANDAPAALKTRLGTTIIELVMPDEPAAIRAQEVLAGALALEPVRTAATLVLAADGGSDVLLSALHVLDSSGLPPAGLEVRQPTLDEVFLRLTGDRSAEPSLGGDRNLGVPA